MTDENVVDKNISIGHELRVARESLDISQQRIADELHLSVRYIEWLEQGEFEKLPSLVFAKGYIRGFAKIVGLDGQPLIAEFDQYYGLTSLNKTPIQSVSKVQEQVKLGDPVMRWSVRIFILALIAAFVWWWQTQYSLSNTVLDPGSLNSSIDKDVAGILGEDGAVNNTEGVVPSNGNTLVLPRLDEKPAESASVGVDSEGSATTAEGVEVGGDKAITEEGDLPEDLTAEQIQALTKRLELEAKDKSEASQENEAVQNAPSAQTASNQSEVSAVESSNPAASTEAEQSTPAQLSTKLDIEFSQDCWLLVKDAEDGVLVAGTKKAGYLLSVDAPTAINVVIGNAQAVKKFSYHGRVIDLAKYTLGNVAKFTLKP